MTGQSFRVRMHAALLTLVLASGSLGVTALAAPRASSRERVDLAEARAQPCTRVGIATSVMAFFGLVSERRFYATRLLWLPQPRLPYAYLLWLNGGSIRTRRGNEVPAAAQRWVQTGGSVLEVIAIKPRIDRERLGRRPAWWLTGYVDRLTVRRWFVGSQKAGGIAKNGESADSSVKSQDVV